MPSTGQEEEQQMSDSAFPSMTALLGLLAVAGYQNRDKIAEMLGGLGQGGSTPQGGPGGSIPQGGHAIPGGQGGPWGQAGQPGSQGGQGGGLGGGLGGLLGGLLGGGSAMGGAGSGGGALNPGGFLGNGLSEIRERFAQAGQRDAVESWVGTGPNREIAPNELEQAVGPEVLQTLSQRTGLSREELLSRLTRELPTAVDRYTPDGRLPQF
jgi:uncharacterized protein YidB (DUF937 family)